MRRRAGLLVWLLAACPGAPPADDPTPATTTGAPVDPTTGTTGTTGTTTAPTTSTGTTTDLTTGTTDLTTDLTTGAPLLRIEPAQATVTVASGWSFPAQFTAVLGDVPVAAAWSVDDPALGRVTRHGGTFTARNTVGGALHVRAEVDGQLAEADVAVELLADHPVCPPRPPLTDGAPAPGAFVRVVAPGYEGTGVYHGLYLPPDWQPGRRYPVLVESPCNKTAAFTGKVDDARLGYHIAGCRSFLWLVLPYIQQQANLDAGWGDLAVVLDYWRTQLRRTLDDYGGDPGAVFVAGFSRGAIGTSWVGLQDDVIADAWLGFFMHSHADVVTPLTPDQGAASATRMARVAGRAALLSWGADGDGGQVNSVKGAELLASFGYPVTTLAVPGVGHTDAWSADDPVTRAQVQDWLFATLAARTGTAAIHGRVTDGRGGPVAGARLSAGLRFAVSDAAGHYTLGGLVPGPRTVACATGRLTCGAPQQVALGVDDLEDLDFVATP